MSALFLLPLGAQNTTALRDMQKLNSVYRYLHGLYVDSVATAPLVEEAIRAMLSELDPHSTYLDREQLALEKESLSGEFSGIGIEFRVEKDTVRVVQVLSGGPSEEVGLLPDDRIVRINDESAIGIQQAEVPLRLRGKEGSRVNLQVWRPAVGVFFNFNIERRKIPLHTVDAAYMLDSDIGYLHINRFGRTTYAEVLKSLMDLMSTIDVLILDLQGNGGGLLNQAVAVASLFLSKDRLVVSTEGRAVQTKELRSQEKGPLRDFPLVILVDESSASASEIVAGALQDWDRALLVGRPTFGKGLVQRQVELEDSSAIRLTVARYHTPSGRVIQRPYERGDREGYYEAHRRRISEGDLDSLALDTLPRYRTLRLGRTVYGGGGIRPDVVIAADTSDYPPILQELLRRRLIKGFVLSHLDRQRSALRERYPSYDDFRTAFRVEEDCWEPFLHYLGEQSFTVEERGLLPAKAEINHLLYIHLASALYGSEVRMRAYNDRGKNRALERAREILHEHVSPWNELLMGEKK